MDSPFKVSSVKSGARNPSRGLGMRPPVVAELGTAESQIQATPNRQAPAIIKSQCDLRFITFNSLVLITELSRLLTTQFDHIDSVSGKLMSACG